jgi:hypothetical protein
MNAPQSTTLLELAARPIAAPAAISEAEAEHQCEHCGDSFAPRQGSSGDKPQRFCSAECKTAFHNAERDTAANVSEKAPNVSSPPPVKPGITSGIGDPYSPGPPIAQAGSDHFDWLDGPEVIIRTQPETAVYRNPYRQVVIRQRDESRDGDDPYVFFAEENLPRLIEVLQHMAKGGD